MRVEIEDYIGVFSEVYPKGFCKHLIEEFDRHQNLGAGSNRQQSENALRHSKDDYQIFCNGKNLNLEPFEDKNTTDVFFQGLQNCFDVYTNKFATLKDIKLFANHMKLQKTTSGGGYHVWHAEQGNDDQARRGLVYMLYLNSLPSEANGETEFWHQQRRITPVENTMLLWPAAFTHAHRGNPVYGNHCKYVVTGWFYHE